MPDRSRREGHAATVLVVLGSVLNVAAAATPDAVFLESPEDGTARGRVVARDIDGDRPTFGLDGAHMPEHGAAAVDPTSGVVTYTPVKDFVGRDAFAVLVNAWVPGAGLKSTSVPVTVTVIGQNDAPVPVPVDLRALEDTALESVLIATDADGDALRFRASALPKHGALRLDETTGAFTYRPAADHHGEDSFVFEVSDGTAKVTGTATIRIASVDDPPVAQPLTLAAVEDTPARRTLAASDVDGDLLKFSLDAARAPQHGDARIDQQTGEITYTPAPDYFGEDTFGVEVAAWGVRTKTEVTVAIAPRNDPPLTTSLELSLSEDGVGKGALPNSDVDGDALSFRVVKRPKHGRVDLDPQSGAFLYLPERDFHGDDSFAIESSDAQLSSLVPVTAHVSAVHDAPAARPLEIAGSEDDTARGRLLVDNVDGDVVSFALDPGRPPAHGVASIDADTGEVTYAPQRDFAGDDAFSVIVKGSSGTETRGDVVVRLAPQNDTPVGESIELSIGEDEELNDAFASTDADGDALTFELTAAPRHGSVDIDQDTGAFLYRPALDYFGDDAFSVEVSDGRATAASAVKVHVTPVDDAPRAVPLFIEGVEDTIARARLDVRDPENDVMVVILDDARLPAHGSASVDPTTGEVTYVPQVDFVGEDVFAVLITAGGKKSVGSVVVEIAPRNDPPPSTALQLRVDEDKALNGAVSLTDVDGDVLDYKLKAPPQHGTVELDAKTGRFTYQPMKDFSGDDAFAVNVSDGSVRSTATVAVRVDAVDDGEDPSGTIAHALALFEAQRAEPVGAGKHLGEAWIAVLDAVSSACEAQPRPSDLAAFARARNVIERELTRDRSAGVVIAEDIRARARVVLTTLEENEAEMSVANIPTLRVAWPAVAMDDAVVLGPPLADMNPSSPFGLRRDPFTKSYRFHAGLDLTAPVGTTIFASAAGVVVFAGKNHGFGNQVVIDHGRGVMSHYAHLSEILVEEGKRVEQGAPIASVGTTGRSTGPHLHFAVTHDGEFVDPAPVINTPIHRVTRR